MFAQGKKFERYQKKYKELVRKHNLNRISLTQLKMLGIPKKPGKESTRKNCSPLTCCSGRLERTV